MAECAVCSAHIGWAFSVDKTATATDWSAAAATATKGAANATRDSDDGVITGSEEGIAFLGLVLTHLRERACTHAELDALPTDSGAGGGDASYPYQLDLLGHEDAWVYSATNPHDARHASTCAALAAKRAHACECAALPLYV